MINFSAFLLQFKAKKKPKKKTYFPVSIQSEYCSKDSAHNDCQRLYEILHGEDGLDPRRPDSSRENGLVVEEESKQKTASKKDYILDRPHLGFFADKFALDNLLDTEGNMSLRIAKIG